MFYWSQELKDARAKFTAALAQYAPDEPMDGPLRLCVKWLYPADRQHRRGEWKVTKPDTDNLIKLFKDCMTATRYWHDDAQVASEIVEKFYDGVQGVFVVVEQLPVALEMDREGEHEKSI